MESIETVDLILSGVALYAAAGSIFALVFLAFGLTRVDHGASGVGMTFRVLIIPGLIALWPLMTLRWLAGGQPHGD